MEIVIDTRTGPMGVSLSTPVKKVQETVPCYAQSWDPRLAGCASCPVKWLCVQQYAGSTLTEALNGVALDERENIVKGYDVENPDLIDALQTSGDIIQYLLQVRAKKAGYPTIDAEGKLIATPFVVEQAPPAKPAPSPPAPAPAPVSPEESMPDGVPLSSLGKKKAAKKTKAPATKKAAPQKKTKAAPKAKAESASDQASFETANYVATTFKGQHYEAKKAKNGAWSWRGGKQSAWIGSLASPRAVQREIQGGQQTMSANRFWHTVAQKKG